MMPAARAAEHLPETVQQEEGLPDLGQRPDGGKN